MKETLIAAVKAGTLTGLLVAGLSFVTSAEARSTEDAYTKAVNVCIEKLERSSSYCERAVLAGTVRNLLEAAGNHEQRIRGLEAVISELLKRQNV